MSGLGIAALASALGGTLLSQALQPDAPELPAAVPPPPLPELPEAPTDVVAPEATVTAEADKVRARKRRATSATRGGLLSLAGGATDAPTTKKTLLGS